MGNLFTQDKDLIYLKRYSLKGFTMDYLSLVLMSISLAMDAFTVSICDGLAYTGISKKKSVFIAFVFGLFQALFPLGGYYLGKVALEKIQDYDHWVAFGLLLIIGGKMVYDGIKALTAKEKDTIKPKEFSYKDVLIQGVAVSIDAFAIGITLLSFSLSIWIDITFIGVITFLICLVGVFLGKIVVKILKGRYEIAELIGGIVLVLLGLKILLNGLGYINW